MTQPLPIDDLEHVLDRTRELWPEARGQHIFLTGGTGFFGCWLVESFLHINRSLNMGAHLMVLTRSPAAFVQKCPHLIDDPALTLHCGDVRDFAFPAGEYRYVIHAATEASAAQAVQRPLEMLDTILRGTARALEFAATHGAQKFLLTSSGAVYGPQPPSLSHIPEDYLGAPNPLVPSSVYAEGKRTAELICALYSAPTGMECKIARCFAFVGPHLPLDTHFAIGNFLRDVMRGDAIRILGDGTPKRSYMYAADLAIWLWTLLFRAPSMEAFNVGSEQSLSILDLAHAVTFALGARSEVRVASRPLDGQPPAQYVPSIQKARYLLGLECHTSLEEAIRRTAAWHGYPLGPLS